MRPLTPAAVLPGRGASRAIAVIAALPRELSLLSRDLGAVTAAGSDGLLLRTASLDATPILLVTAGMGAQRVSIAVQAALAHAPLRALVSVGLAGACNPQLTPASEASGVSLVIDTASGERYGTDPRFQMGPAAVLATARHIAGLVEKQRLHASYNADLVDMEAAAVGRLARAHGIPFGAIKAVSEEQSVDLTHLSSFADARGQFRTAAFAAHTLLHPRQWRTAVELGRNSKVALASLTAALHQLLSRHGSDMA